MPIPKVSVIVTTYNRAHLVPETIDSILSQTFRDFELIVVDNESTDNTEEVIKRYADERMSYFKHQNNGIVAVNRNYGIRQARGEYVAFCDDDDLWMPSKLEKQMEEIEKDNRVGLVCTNAINFDEHGDQGIRIKRRLEERHFTFEMLLRHNWVSSSTALVRKSVLDDIGWMDESRELMSAEDYELWLRVAKKYAIRYIDLPLEKYRTHRHVYRKKGAVAEMLHSRTVFERLREKGLISPELCEWRLGRLNREIMVTRLLTRTRLLKCALLMTRTLRNLKNMGLRSS